MDMKKKQFQHHPLQHPDRDRFRLNHHYLLAKMTDWRNRK